MVIKEPYCGVVNYCLFNSPRANLSSNSAIALRAKFFFAASAFFALSMSANIIWQASGLRLGLLSSPKGEFETSTSELHLWKKFLSVNLPTSALVL